MSGRYDWHSQTIVGDRKAKIKEKLGKLSKVLMGFSIAIPTATAVVVPTLIAESVIPTSTTIHSGKTGDVINSLKSQVKTLQDEKDKLTAEITPIKNELANTKKDLEAAKTKVAELQKEVDSDSEELKVAKAEEEKLQGQVNDLTAKLAKLQSDYDAAEKRIQGDEEQIAALQKALDNPIVLGKVSSEDFVNFTVNLGRTANKDIKLDVNDFTVAVSKGDTPKISKVDWVDANKRDQVIITLASPLTRMYDYEGDGSYIQFGLTKSLTGNRGDIGGTGYVDEISAGYSLWEKVPAIASIDMQSIKNIDWSSDYKTLTLTMGASVPATGALTPNDFTFFNGDSGSLATGLGLTGVNSDGNKITFTFSSALNTSTPYKIFLGKSQTGVRTSKTHSIMAGVMHLPFERTNTTYTYASSNSFNNESSLSYSIDGKAFFHDGIIYNSSWSSDYFYYGDPQNNKIGSTQGLTSSYAGFLFWGTDGKMYGSSGSNCNYISEMQQDGSWKVVKSGADNSHYYNGKILVDSNNIFYWYYNSHIYKMNSSFSEIGNIDITGFGGSLQSFNLDDKNNVWFTTTNGCLYEATNDGKVILFSNSLSINLYNDIVFDNKGNAYTINSSNYLYKIDPTKGFQTPVKITIPSGSPMFIYINKKNSIFVSSSNGEIYKIDENGVNLQTIKTNTSTPIPMNLFSDEEDNLFFSANDGYGYKLFNNGNVK